MIDTKILSVTYGMKGGGKEPKPPVESPDTLSNTALARIVDLVSEGEIVGLVNGAASIFLDETPSKSDGVYNFGGFDWQERHGSLYQESIKGFPNAESETTVNFSLKYGQPYVRSINKLELSAVRVRIAIPKLASIDAKGNTGGATVSWKIEIQTDGGPYVEAKTETVTAKASSEYQRSTRVDLPSAKVGWMMRVTRLTPDSTSDTLANASIVAAITEVIDAKFVMPNSALIATQFDAQSFSGIPKRTFHIRGRIISVPTNYNAEQRTYANSGPGTTGGVWDGTFKPAYTNNPAWIYYDLLLHKRYGLGDQISPAQVDKWELYRIAQYCDQMVDDGKGGLEPRFTCNLYLQERAPALRVMQDIASVFRGISYWGAGQTYVSADMPGDPVHTFTNAQVIDGIFEYKGSPLESIYNVALVSWNDPADFYRQKVEYVQDRDAIAAYGGINKVEMVAFGCSSQGQAQRAGKWALITNSLESEIVSFKVPLSGAFVRPGEVFKIADNDLGGRSIGGRIIGFTKNSITTDRAVVARPGDIVTLMSGGEPVTMTVKSYDSASMKVTFTADFAPGITVRRMDPWAIESDDLKMTHWRVSSISEGEGSSEGMTFNITATKHVPGKFNSIEYGTAIEKPPITVIPPSVQQPVREVRLSTDWGIEQTMAVTTMTIAWDAVPNATSYEVQWRVNDKDWVYAGTVYAPEVSVTGIYSGRYVARVQAVNSIGVHSRWTESAVSTLQGKTGEPPKVAYLKAIGITFGIGLEWGFLPGSSDTLRTEIEYGNSNNPAGAIKLGDFAYPINTHTMMGLAAGQRFFFRARLVDRSGNIGPWSEFIDGSSSNQATPILDYLKGQITQTELGKDLAEEIPKISGNVPGSVNERIKDAQDAVLVQIDNINAQLAQIAGSEDWKAGVPYKTNTIVKHKGALYRATKDNINSEPPSANWEKIGDYASVGEALAGMAVQLNDLKTSVNKIDGNLTALSTKYDGIFAQINPPMAGSMGDYAGAVTVMAGVWSDRSARASEDSALAIRIDGVTASVGENKADILRVETAMVTKTEALASDIRTMDVKVDGNAVAIVNEAKARATADEALGEQIVSMKAEVNNEINPKLNKISADLQEESRVRANADGALSERITSQGARVDGVDAAIKEESRVRASETGYLTQQTNILQGTVDGHTSSIQQNTSLVNKLNGDIAASWSVKMQVNDVGGQQWAGFGLGIDGSSGKLESRFFIAADQFYITSSLAGGYKDVPFAVVNGQTFMKSAFIQDGTINMLKIGDNLQSDDYIAGQRGWKLWKGGDLEFNGSLPGGGRLTMTSRSIRVYDENNVKRVQLGDLRE